MPKEKKQFKGQNKKNDKHEREVREFEQKMVDLARVTRVMKGGKRMSFRACVVIGNSKGKVGYGLAKGVDVQLAMGKAVAQAERDMVSVPLTEGSSIPHEVKMKYKSARILLKPAKDGTGVKAGGALRVVLNLAGVSNVVAKQFGSSNKVTNVKAIFEALKSLRTKETKIKKADKK